ncbi:hypothetical protein V8E36_006961 [Tilletia maclaganii]
MALTALQPDHAAAHHHGHHSIHHHSSMGAVGAHHHHSAHHHLASTGPSSLASAAASSHYQQAYNPYTSTSSSSSSSYRLPSSSSSYATSGAHLGSSSSSSSLFPYPLQTDGSLTSSNLTGSYGMQSPYPLGPSGMLQPPTNIVKSKRIQVKNACINCQRACKKCDTGRPCTRCIKYGLTDTCADSSRKERKRGIKRGPYKRRTNTSGSATSTSSLPTPPMSSHPFSAPSSGGLTSSVGVGIGLTGPASSSTPSLHSPYNSSSGMLATPSSAAAASASAAAAAAAAANGNGYYSLHHRAATTPMETTSASAASSSYSSYSRYLAPPVGGLRWSDYSPSFGVSSQQQQQQQQSLTANGATSASSGSASSVHTTSSGGGSSTPGLSQGLSTPSSAGTNGSGSFPGNPAANTPPIYSAGYGPMSSSQHHQQQQQHHHHQWHINPNSTASPAGLGHYPGSSVLTTSNSGNGALGGASANGGVVPFTLKMPSFSQRIPFH